MLYFTPEGSKLKTGINFYPLSEWKWNRGFRILTPIIYIYFRYSVRLKRIIWEAHRVRK